MLPSLSLLSILPVLLSASARAGAFDFKEHLGRMSPPFTPSFGLPVADGGSLGTGMPSNCSVSQVQVVKLFFDACTRAFPLTTVISYYNV